MISRMNGLNEYYSMKKMVLKKSFKNLTVGKIYDCSFFGIMLKSPSTIKVFSVVNDNYDIVEVPETHFISIEESRENKINNILS